MKAQGKGFWKAKIVPMLLGIGTVFMFSLPAHPVHAYENLVVVIDPGHGGFSTEDETDTGACYNGVEEKTVDMITAQALYDELSQYGNLTVYLTRTEDKHMELQERVDFAKEVGADVLIAVHYNASAYHHFYGSEIFTSAYGEDYAKGHSLAETIMSWWVESGMLNKGIKTRIGNRGDYYGLIRMGHEAGIPTIILEHAYLDIDTDFSRISTPEDWKKMGILDATAIADYFGVKKGVVSADVGWNLTVPVPTAQVDDDKTPPTDINVTIDSFDPESGLLTYTVSAIDRESDLFYYDIDTEANTANEAECFSNLSVWESGKDSVQGSFIVPDGYRGKFVVRVFNIYQQHADSVPVSIPEEFLPEEERTKSVAASPGVTLANGTSMPQVTLSDGSGATWTLEGALKDAKGASFLVGHDGQLGRSNYIGMIVAGAVVILMLIASIAMAVATSRRKKKRRHR